MRVWWLLATAALARPLEDRTLVVIDANGAPVEGDAIRGPLEARGHSVEVKAVRDGVELFTLGERQYDNVLILPGKTKGLGKGLSARSMLHYLQDGGNLAVLTTPESSPVSVRETAAQLGIRVSPRGVGLVDYFGGQVGANAFEVPSVVEATTLELGSSAVAHVDDLDGFAFGLIKTPATSYSFNKLESSSSEAAEPWSYGAGYVAAATQLRNNARFAWLGSADVLLNPAGADILAWAFQEKGVLRVNGVAHNSSTGTHHVYKIEEDVTYCAGIEEWTGEEWAPFSGTDVQVDFRMLDPYYRVGLEPSSAGQCVTFKIPDQYGMFTFDLEYARRGLSYLKDEQLVTIRHTANDEWPRSWQITNSWVYISSALSVIGAWVLFVGIYFS